MKLKNLALGALVLATPFSVHANVTDAIMADGFGMKLAYPAVHTGNAASENAINKDIRHYAREMQDVYEGGKDEVYMTYSVKYESEDIVSIVLETAVTDRQMANPDAKAYGLVYNKKTGDLINRSDFGLKVDNKEIVKDLKEGKLDLYDMDGKKLAYDPSFVPAGEQTEYFLNGKQEIALLYQPGELAPYADGATYVTFKMK